MKASTPEELTLLIDGDVVAFTAASAAQYVHEDEFGFFTPFANRKVGEAILDNMMIGLEQLFDCTHMRVALTDPADNFRKQIYPAYKAFRKEVARPLLLDALKQYLRDKWGAFHWDSLEADDVLGILNTEPQDYPGKRILVGKDKDFKTVPGFYHRLGDLTPGGKPIVAEITEAQAQRFHLYQTLLGDATDGYPGCPGIGKVRAEQCLDDPQILIPTQGVKTRGVNKGHPTAVWRQEPTRDLWAMVVSHYAKGMQGVIGADPEAAALTTARLAHILRHEDYDREGKGIILWTPDKIKQL